MPNVERSPFASTGARTQVGLGVGFFCLSLTLGCTPFGVDNDDSVAPDEHDVEDNTVDGELEDLYAPLPDDDRSQAVETHAEDLRCWKDSKPKQAWELDDPNADPESGMLRIERDGKFLALPLQHTQFDAVVVGTVAETTITQVFANPFDEAIEAVYMFPLHERAAVDDYWLTIGERSIRGQMQTRAQAQKTYDEAKRDGRAAGLLEQQRPNIFTQQVANIPPGQAIEVSMHVVQPLEQDHGSYALVLPTVVGPRYISSNVRDAAKITAPIIPEGYTTCADVDVSVAIESGLRPRALRSKFHDIAIQRTGDVALIELDRSAGPVLANRDFELSWDLGQHQPQAAIVAQAEDGGGYFTLTVQPPERVTDEQAVPRELVFVVDNSGSMSGAPMDTAKLLMRRALKGMRPDDTFNVLRFSENASALSSALLPATKANVSKGLDYVDAMAGMGGTEMTAGIRAALELPHDDERVRIVMFLTDGYIGNEADIFSLIDQDIGDARLFSLGVGSAPNRYLLDGMASVGRGAVTYAAPSDDADLAIDRFYERVETPVLTDLEIDWQGLAVAEVLPGKIPDLFAGQPLTVFGRYQGAPSGEIVVRGKARGQLVELPVRFNLAKADDLAGVSSIWARNKIDGMLGYPNQQGSEAVEKAVVEVALEHRIMTEFTSFVAVDEVRVVDPDGTVRTVVQPLPIPQGTTHEGFMGDSYGIGGLGTGYGRGGGGGFGGSGQRVPQVRQAKATVTGSLDKDIIRRIVRAHVNEVRSCYNAGLTTDPSLTGRVVIKFTIAASGKVVSASVETNDTGSKSVGTCIAKATKTWKFPKVGGGGQAVIHYPFVLSPG